ncbi:MULTISPECIES: DUF899 family protein [unclassified Streptomyces]|uniref:DUF899 domain-containing protein n=2 Tax=Streptomyces TaxID=1883 RepID=A0AAU1HVQ1_9ACTN|nr:DUF899 domain-containing protein [Streptomyces sp. NBC_01017]
MFRYTRLPGESAEYLAAREELRLAEIELTRQGEEVAARRRALPPGPPVDDYAFLEGPADLAAGDEPVREVRLSELFTAPERPLLMYQFMYGKADTEPCPMCTMWIDGFSNIAHHITRNADFVVAAAADPPVLRQHARSRGWHRLRLLSCGDSTFKYDTGSEDKDGAQDATVSVFTRDGDGTLRHFYSAHPRMSDDIGERGIDRLAPVWNLLDLLPQGRGDWYPSVAY